MWKMPSTRVRDIAEKVARAVFPAGSVVWVRSWYIGQMGPTGNSMRLGVAVEVGVDSAGHEGHEAELWSSRCEYLAEEVMWRRAADRDLRGYLVDVRVLRLSREQVAAHLLGGKP